jgi:hypothetical protein
VDPVPDPLLLSKSRSAGRQAVSDLQTIINVDGNNIYSDNLPSTESLEA